MNSVQSKMARAALGWGVRDLAKMSAVAVDTISRLERGEAIMPRTLSAIQSALEVAGIEFINNDRGDGVVKLRDQQA
ncbi:helix-turn-helix transcriptional regulator [Rhizobium favelukesii]|nr:helix-turn-helix transcriptional regulator [Rhizobium favelukesii]MCS0459950.1 helix-turn-helix transcriptional regulator [Rhizobium favelukesii]